MLGHSRESMRRNWPPIATFRRRANVPRSRSTGEYITTRLRGRRAGTLPFAGVPGSARARPRDSTVCRGAAPGGDSAARRPWRSLRGAARGWG